MFRIDGLGDLKATLERLPNVLKPILRTVAIRPTVDAVEEAARRRIRNDTGALASKLTGWMFREEVGGSVGIASGVVATAQGSKNPRKYAHLVEFGTSKMAARPFLFPAAESQRGAYLLRLQAAGRVFEQAVTSRISVSSPGGSGLL